MGYREVSLDSFNTGINLRDKVDAVAPNEAIDAMNVTFSNRGAVQTRAGYDRFTAASPVFVTALSPFYKASGTKQLLSGGEGELHVYDTSATDVGSITVGLANALFSFVRFGAPTAEVAYAGNGTDTLRKWDGTSWTAPTATVNASAGAAMPKAGTMAVWSVDNRLVVSGFDTTTGGPAGAASSPSTVFFSNQGLPETWETDGAAGRGRNFIELAPGDGEKIMAIVPWREMLFVFKETKFFVFYGIGTNSDGTPKFLYRPVTTGQGMATRKAVTVGRDGVYFMSRRGVYRTSGDKPELLSSAIDPLWVGGLSAYSLHLGNNVIDQAQLQDVSMIWHEEKVYLSYTQILSGGPSRTLVYDTRDKWWTMWDLPAHSFAVWRPGDYDELMFANSSGTPFINRHSPAYTDDAGVAFLSRWHSGWFDLKTPSVKVIRQSRYYGTGTVVVEIPTDFRTTVSQDQTLTFDPTIPTAVLARRAHRGVFFATKFLGFEPWSMNRVVHHVRETKAPSASQRDY